MLFYYEDAAGKYAHQEKPVINNTFTISGDINQSGSARMLFKKAGEVISSNEQENRIREFYIEAGTLTLSGAPANLESLKLTGSKTEAEYEEKEAKIAPILK